MKVVVEMLRSLFVAAGTLGVLLHFTVRDSLPIASTLFYALPLPADAGLFLAAAVLGIRHRLWRNICLVAAVAVAGFWLATTFGRTPVRGGDLRVATWNLGRPRHPFQPLIDLVRHEQPDFLALIEIGGLNADIAREYDRALPGYHCAVFEGGLACLSRGPIINPTWRSILGGGQAVELSTTLKGHRVRVLVSDLSADVFLDRGTEFAALANLAGTIPRTIILGDFNTPIESVHIDVLRKTHICATRVAGRGFRETWFFGLPLLSLDQIWTSPDLPPVVAHRDFTLASDHAPVIADLRVAPKP